MKFTLSLILLVGCTSTKTHNNIIKPLSVDPAYNSMSEDIALVNAMADLNVCSVFIDELVAVVEFEESDVWRMQRIGRYWDRYFSERAKKLMQKNEDFAEVRNFLFEHCFKKDIAKYLGTPNEYETR